MNPQSNHSPPLAAAEHRALLALVLLAVVAGFWVGIGSVPLFDLDEGAFSEATREMFERGDFISTYLNGEPRYDKPILVYWLQAGAVLAFGVTEFAFRLPSALSASLWVLLVGAFLGRVAGPRESLYGAGLTATALMIMVMAKAATADALLNVLLAAAVLAAYLHLREGGRRWIHAAFACAGLGFLAKGPVAVLVPAAVTFLYCLSRREPGRWLRAMFHPGGLLLFAAIALPWYLAQYLKEGDAFIQGFFMKHNVGRFSSPMEGHGGGFLYYLPVLLLGVLPHTALLFRVFARWRAVWADDLQRFMLLWFAFVFVFFSLSGTKLPHYLNYGYTGLMVLMALHLDGLRSRWLTLLPGLLYLGFVMALPRLILAALPLVEDPYYRAALGAVDEYAGAAWYGGFAAALAVGLYLAVERRRPPGQKLLVLGAVMALANSTLLFPLAGDLQQRPVREAAAVARKLDAPLVMWGINTPSFSVYVQRVVPRREPRPGEVVLTKSHRLERLGDYTLLYDRQGVALARVRP
jgi:4-amino-4-deoxy-L-arabinose transferase-like glycosyltransferase